jgi:hypothetical protein
MKNVWLLALWISLGGAVIGGGAYYIGAKSAPTPQPQTEEEETKPAVPIKISDLKTYWLVGVPAQAGEWMCAPAVAFTVTNISGADITNAEFSVSFLDDQRKNVYGSGSVYWIDPIGPLPPGFERKVSIVSAIGVSSAAQACDDKNALYLPALLPLKAVVRAKIDSTDEFELWRGSVATAAMVYAGELHDPYPLPDPSTVP